MDRDKIPDAPWIGWAGDEYEEHLLRAIHYRIGKDEEDADKEDDKYDDED